MNSKDIGFKTFLHENKVEIIESIESQFIYKYDKDLIDSLMKEKPWKKDPHYFQAVHISVLALIKMLTHAKSGGNIEVMGIMQGKVYPNIMVITDVFSLPVEGTETRVNAANEANEYMIDYLTRIKEVGRLENAIGWYHSHPGYGCWLSGIDVSTQTMNQTFQDPFLAIVVDPIRTLSTGKVELGAFRTFPENYTPSESFKSEDTNIPLNKVEDFGVHHSKYYPVKVSYFKSHLDNYIIDQLWSKYWVETLTKSSLFVNRQYHTNQLADLGTKFQRLDSYSLFNDFSRFDSKPSNGKGPNATPIDKVAQSANLINNELSQGLMSQMIKSTLFPQKD